MVNAGCRLLQKLESHRGQHVDLRTTLLLGRLPRGKVGPGCVFLSLSSTGILIGGLL